MPVQRQEFAAADEKGTRTPRVKALPVLVPMRIGVKVPAKSVYRMARTLLEGHDIDRTSAIREDAKKVSSTSASESNRSRGTSDSNEVRKRTQIEREKGPVSS
jgi:hypothetical protein